MIHNLKCESQYFRAVKRGDKTFEIRKDDRNFQVGDIINLQEWDTHPDEAGGGNYFTGAEFKVRITCKVSDERFCKLGFCVLGIEPVSQTVEERLKEVEICLTESDRERPGVQWIFAELRRLLLRLEKSEANR